MPKQRTKKRAGAKPVDPQREQLDRKYRSIITWLKHNGEHGWQSKICREMLGHGYQRVTLIKTFGFNSATARHAADSLQKRTREAKAPRPPEKKILHKTNVVIEMGKCTHWVVRDGKTIPCGAPCEGQVCKAHQAVQQPKHGLRWLGARTA